jgi:hypothetical protein
VILEVSEAVDCRIKACLKFRVNVYIMIEAVFQSRRCWEKASFLIKLLQVKRMFEVKIPNDSCTCIYLRVLILTLLPVQSSEKDRADREHWR